MSTTRWFRRAGLRLAALACLLPGAAIPAARAAGPEAPNPQDVRRGLEKLARTEFGEMALAVLGGSDMGPASGWFHPSQSRYGWKWLAARCDKDRDGTITAKEFDGPRDLFERLDRDRDGVITAADFDWSERSPYVRTSMQAGSVFRMFDRDSNGKVTRGEWDKLFEQARKGKDFLTPDDVLEMLFPPRPRPAKPPSSADGPSRALLLKGLLTGELGSPFAGPDLNAPAPPFALPTPEGDREISLDAFRAGKPVVLIFGSFT